MYQLPLWGGCYSKIKNIIRNEGYLSLWRGNMVNVVRAFPTQGFNFAFNEYFYNIIFQRRRQAELMKIRSNKYKHFIESCISGGLAGAATLTLVYPLELIRTRLALDFTYKDGYNISTKRKFTGFYDCFEKIYKKDKIQGLYKGYIISVLGIMQYRALFFGGLNLLNNMLLDRNTSVVLFFLLKFVLLPFPV